MAKGISVHVGINYVDENIYGTRAELKNCVNDAEDFRRIADIQGFATTLLINEEAKAETIRQKWITASEELEAGDIFLYTVSSHGSQIPTLDPTEEDSLDETHVCFDRQMIDNEYFELQGLFRRGVFIVFVSDTCHSGTIFKLFDALVETDAAHRYELALHQTASQSKARSRKLENNFENADPTTSKTPKHRLLGEEASSRDYESHKHFYRDLQRKICGAFESIRASSLLISGCQDNQLSSDGSGRNGLMTETLLSTWDSGRFVGNYKDLHERIVSNMPPWQVPNLKTLNDPNSLLLNQKPFTLNAQQLAKRERVISPTQTPTFFPAISNLRVKDMQVTTEDARFLESVAIAAATVAGEALIEEIFRGQPRSRDLVDAVEVLAKEVASELVNELFRSGALNGRGSRSRNGSRFGISGGLSAGLTGFQAGGNIDFRSAHNRSLIGSLVEKAVPVLIDELVNRI